MTARRISGWPVWQVVWAAGVASTVALLAAGMTAYSETTTIQSCPGSPPGPSIGVLCPHPVLVTSRPHELRGAVLLAAAAVWALATVVLARSFRPTGRRRRPDTA